MDESPQTPEQDDTDAPLLQTREGAVLWLTLNRPARRNALSPALYGVLHDALSHAAADDSVGAVVLTGAGDAFCAGGDVKRMAATTPAHKPPFESRVQALRHRTQICELLHTMDKPTVAMMRGPAVGAGLSLALACDLRYADTTVRMKTGFLNVGLPGDFGGHYFLPRIVGMARARELYLLAPMLDARQAMALGLVNALYEADELQPEVARLATQLATGPRVATAHMKRNLNDGLRLPLPQMLDQECWRLVRCTDTDDHREAVRAFAEKRPPRFER